MNLHCKGLRRALALLLLTAALSGTALAATLELDSRTVSCLSQEVFSEDASALSGVFISAVPSPAVCTVRYGARRVCAGDVLPAAALEQLRVKPVSDAEAECSLYYRPVYSNGIGMASELRISLLNGKNQPPTAADSTFETYKNISNSGTLKVSDPDGDALTYTLVRAPKRGTVELHEDGTFTYTPEENKVGKDSFVFTAADPAGNVSNEACVKIKIVKPTDRAVYSDLDEDAQYLGVWLREQGAYTGRTVAGHLCFAPDEAIRRGEFLIMAMHLLDCAPEEAALTSGFADESDTPQWMRPYIVSALRSGVVSGAATEAGVFFRPSDALTHAEAAVMVQGLMKLPQPDTQAVFSQEAEETVPAWAQDAVAALTAAGFTVELAAAESPMTRLEAAQLLYQVCACRQAESEKQAQ